MSAAAIVTALDCWVLDAREQFAHVVHMICEVFDQPTRKKPRGLLRVIAASAHHAQSH